MMLDARLCPPDANKYQSKKKFDIGRVHVLYDSMGKSFIREIENNSLKESKEISASSEIAFDQEEKDGINDCWSSLAMV
jgi:hypothetical protein